MKEIILGGGCFWCLEAIFQRLKGVNKVVSGYSGGHIKNPPYREVCNGTTGHAEVLKIQYDSDVIDLNKILEVFFASHNPTTLNRQGNDVGTQYRSIVFYKDEEEKRIIDSVVANFEESIWADPIVTEISAVAPFYPAEEYHQSYFNNNANKPYCSLVINPKIAKLKKSFADLVKTENV